MRKLELQFRVYFLFFPTLNLNNRYCGNPADYNLSLDDNEISDMNTDLNYGMTRFSNLIQSLMTMFNFIDAIGWSSIIYSVVLILLKFSQIIYNK